MNSLSNKSIIVILDNNRKIRKIEPNQVTVKVLIQKLWPPFFCTMIWSWYQGTRNDPFIDIYIDNELFVYQWKYKKNVLVGSVFSHISQNQRCFQSICMYITVFRRRNRPGILTLGQKKISWCRHDKFSLIMEKLVYMDYIEVVSIPLILLCIYSTSIRKPFYNCN